MMYTLPLMVPAAGRAADAPAVKTSPAGGIDLRVDTSRLAAVAATVDQSRARYDVLANHATELSEEYYTETEDPARVRAIHAELVQLRDQALEFEQVVDSARDALDEAYNAAHAAADDAYDAARARIEETHDATNQRIEDIDGFEYLSPQDMADHINGDIADIEKFLADHEADESGIGP